MHRAAMALLHGSCILRVGLLILAAAAGVAAAQAEPSLVKPGCTNYKCGDLTIPYPFGIGEACYLEPKFNITCNETTKSAYWTDFAEYSVNGHISITGFSLDEGELNITQNVVRTCEGPETTAEGEWLVLPPLYTLSTKNQFFTLGCDAMAIFTGQLVNPDPAESTLIAGYGVTLCTTLLGKEFSDSCSGYGCSQHEIPSGMQNFTISLSGRALGDSSLNETAQWYSDYPCSYSFIVDPTNFTFSGNKSFEQLNKTTQLPAIVNWVIEGDIKNCSNNSCPDRTCANRPIEDGPSGYTCRCLEGYEGNPYLSVGCQDTDECQSINSCDNGDCINTFGNYTCQCKSGYRNEDDPRICSKYKGSKTLKITVGVLASFFVLLIIIFWIYCGMKRRKFLKLKDMYFKQNGGLHLKQQLASYNGTVATTARIFTEEELKKATHNYNEKIGEGAYGTVYKGKLSDGTDVAIKKSKVNSPPAQSNQFVNEVIVLSEINHKNVVRLLGCCLETPTPILVYEYVSNGTLYDLIHKKEGKDGPRPMLSLEKRLNIAAGTADALAYLHYSTTLQIIHRDVKASNILLDKDYTAKVSDFGASRLVPEDQDQLSTLVQGTRGYLDPEYLQSNTLTEKSDVYSFGVVLAELLTGTQALSFEKPEAERNLANYFVCSVEEGSLGKILDAEIIKEGNFELVQKVANLTKRCLRLKGGERPSMKVVFTELEGLIENMEKQVENADYKRSPKETDYLLGSPNLNAYVVDVKGEVDARGSSSIATGTLEYDRSMQTQAPTLKPNNAGR